MVGDLSCRGLACEYTGALLGQACCSNLQSEVVLSGLLTPAGSRIQVAETSQYRDSQPDVTAAFHQNHTAAANGQGQPSYAQSSTIGGHAAAEAFASSGAHNNRYLPFFIMSAVVVPC